MTTVTVTEPRYTVTVPEQVYTVTATEVTYKVYVIEAITDISAFGAGLNFSDGDNIFLWWWW